MKKCIKCGLEKPLEDFYKQKTTKDGHGSYCKQCVLENNRKRTSRPEVKSKIRKHNQSRKKERNEWQKDYNRTHRLEVLLYSCKTRAKKQDITFDLSIDDLQMPTHCPILGIELRESTKGFQDHSPSLDRLIPELGYVKGNVCIISFRANRLKNNGTAEELRRIADWMDAQTKEAA